jgi:sec-independent protein translocase protein TatC
MATALRKPIGHEDRLSLIEHLDELRSRLIVCVGILAVSFSLCAWQNGRLLDFINKPLDKETQKNVEKGRGPLGQIEKVREVVRDSGAVQVASLRALAHDRSVSPATRATAARGAAAVAASLKTLPKVTGNKPVTLGVGEPFATTLKVAFYFSLLLAMPFLLWQLYAFVLPAFTPEERRGVTPLLALIPVLFLCGVAFGYYLVLPAAVRFLQNFNADQFNILVQARDYYRFAVITLLALGLVFQLPVGILALVRMHVVTIQQLRKNRRYAIVVLAVVAMLLPGTDPVSMLVEFVPLLALYELSILLASIFGRSWETAEDDADLSSL